MLSYVRNIVEIRGQDVPTRHRLYPRNIPEIIINIKNLVKAEINGKIKAAEEVTIQGSKTDYVDAYHPKNCHFISIRFEPNGFYKLIGITQKSFTDNYYHIEDIIDNDVDCLIMKLQEARSPKRRLRIICRWLREDIRREDTPSQLLSDLIITRLKRHPHLSVEELAEQTGYSRKHLVHQFKEEAGLTIKEYQKINRLRRVRKSVSETEDVHWAEVACGHGFYDQSHLIRDFKRYTGRTPTDYLDRRQLVKA